MIQRELLVEEFLFTCAHCAHAWSVEYDVQHVEDGHGHECDYFFLHHHPSADPTAPQAVTCPACQSTQVRREAGHAARRAAGDAGDAGDASQAYSESIRAWLLSSTTLRRTFIDGVSSPDSMVRSWSSSAHRLMVSQRLRRPLSSSM